MNRKRRIRMVGKVTVQNLGLSFSEWFWLNMDVSEGAAGCWYFGQNKGPNYSEVTRNGSTERAHRVAVELVIGRKPSPDEHVLHACDNPPCCNPNHLSLGSHQDNMDDMMKRGRWNGGPRPILADNELKTVLEHLDNGGTLEGSARMLNVSISAIKSAFERSEKYERPDLSKVPRGGRHPKLTKEQRTELWGCFRRGGDRQIDLAKRFKISRATIYRERRLWAKTEDCKWDNETQGIETCK